MTRRRSVSVLPFTEPPLRVLLLLRPEARAAGWQPVTGRVEPGDAAWDASRWLPDAVASGEMPQLAAACLREIHEETGLPEPLELLDLGLETTFTGYDGAVYGQRAFAARYADAPAPLRTPEHEAWRWCGADEAAALLRWDDDRAALARLAERLRGT